MPAAPLEFESCYRALLARDPRFDGLFYTAVRSTGIYCRPVCPARTPARRSCSFFATAAAAERAGFRPCLRCRPELAPGRPDFFADLARSIYARLAEGVLDDHSVEDLARDIGVSSRHLRRLLLEHFGVTPIEVAQTQRLLFAKKLLQETRLPMTEVALASGFKSVRRFNAVFLQRYQLSPSQLRRKGNSDALAEEDICLRLHYRPPLHFGDWLAYLGARAVPGIEVVDALSYRRTVRITIGERELAGRVSVRADPLRDAVVVEVSRSLSGALLPLMQRVRRLFDLDAEPATIAAHLAEDELFAPLLADGGALRVPGAWEAFELGVRAVLGQQVSVQGASTLNGRLIRRFATPWATPLEGLTHLPLCAADLAGQSVEAVAAIGLPRARAATLIALAQAALAGQLSFAVGTPAASIVAALQTIPGIGPWTAEYMAMRAFGHVDAFPAGDLGLRQAVAHLTGSAPPSIKALEAMSARWRPWRAYAASLLWSTLRKEVSA